MRLKVGGKYGLRDKGAIVVESEIMTDTFNQFRCRTETGEVLFYNRYGRCLPVNDKFGGYDTVSVISEPA